MPPFDTLMLPSIIFQDLPTFPSLCKVIQIKIIDFKSCGRRIPNPIVWELISSKPNDDPIINLKINNILTVANLVKTQTLISFPIALLDEFSTYEFMVTITTYLGTKSS